jgi:hypothetical protein
VQDDLVRSGPAPEADGLRHLFRAAGDGRGAVPAHRRQPPGRVRAGDREQVEDDLVRAGAARGGARRVEHAAGAAQFAGGGGRGVEDGAVGVLAAELERAGAGGGGEERRRRRRGPAERHVVQLDVPAVRRQALAVEQAAQRRQVLPEQRQRRRGARADLAHPALHAVADADRDPAGEQPLQRGRFHRGQRDVPQRDRQHTDRHRQPVRPGEDRRREGHPAAPEAVLPQPELRQPGVLRRARHRAHLFRRNLRPACRSESRHAPILPPLMPPAPTGSRAVEWPAALPEARRGG